MLGYQKRKEKQRKINKSVKKKVMYYPGNLLKAAHLANEIIYCISRNLCRVNKD